MNIEHISVSRLGTWEQCRQMYKYRYHLKLQPPGPEAPWFEYGKAVHKIIECHTASRGKVQLSEITKAVLTGEIELEPGRKCGALSLDYRKKLPLHLRAYLRLAEKIGFEGEIERPFHYDLAPPEGLFVKGFIDRVIITSPASGPAKARIVDWKTTKKGPWRKGPKDITHDLQLKTYCRVIWRELGILPENIQAALYYLDGGELVGAKFTEKSLIEAEEILASTFRDIRDSDASAVVGTVGDHCRRCDYKDMCPFWRNSSKNRPAPWEH